MPYYKILLETGKKRSSERKLFVTDPTILGALDISKKVKNSTMKNITPISRKEYMTGVGKKYDN